VRLNTSMVRMPNTTLTATSSRPSCQLISSDTGTSTNTATTAAQSSRKNSSQIDHSASVPAVMIFISRPECAPPWKLCGSCSTCS
jgi:hypothetical protein